MIRSVAVDLALQNMRLQLSGTRRVVVKPKWPSVWRYPLGVEDDYTAAIAKEMRPFFDIVNEELARYPNWVRNDIHMDAFAADWDTSLKRLRAYQRNTYEENEGRGMYTMVTRFGEVADNYNKREWSKYLSSLAGQQYFPPAEDADPEATTRWADTNFELIRSLSDEYIKKVNVLVVEAVSQGTKYTDLVKSIQKLNSNISGPRARLIARDQVGKLNGALAGSRQKAAGITDYTWKTAHDERVRSTHTNMSEKICEWDDATTYKPTKNFQKWLPRNASMPTGAPGHEIQCRCYAQPNMDAIWEEAEAIAEAEGWYKKPKKGGAR